MCIILSHLSSSSFLCNLQSGEVEEEHKESFVLTAVFHAVEEGNFEGIQELVENLTSFDPNQKNKVSFCKVEVSVWIYTKVR